MDGEMDGIDRHFQPCYIDWCPEEGLTDLQIAPGEWRSFCNQHAAEHVLNHPPSPPKPARSRRKAEPKP